MAYYLREVTHCKPPLNIPLTAAEVIIGTQYVQLRGFSQMSEKHAVFYKSDEGYLFIKDLDSYWGTYVNDVKIGSAVKALALGDTIGFGVNPKSPENGFVCEIKKEPEIIELLDEDDDLPNIGINSVKTESPPYPGIKTFDAKPRNALPVNTVILSNEGDCFQNIQTTPSTSRNYTVFQQHQLCKSIKNCSVSLIRCDSKKFPWPSGVKNPFLIKTKDDEDILSSRKKRPRPISSDSSDESCEEYNLNASHGISSKFNLEETGNKQNQFNNNKYNSVIDSKSSPKSFKQTFSQPSTSRITKISTRKHSNNDRNLKSSIKRARRLSSDSSDEILNDPSSSESYKNRSPFPMQLKAESCFSSNYWGLPELSSDSSVESLDGTIYSDKNNLSNNSNMHPEASSFDSTVRNSSRNRYFNSSTCSTKKIENFFSDESYETNIKKTGVSKKTFRTSDDNLTNITDKGFHITEDSCVDASNVPYPLAEEILYISDVDDEPENVCKQIFGDSEESETLSSTNHQNSPFQNQEPESVEEIQEYVNCFNESNSVKAITGGNNELNSKLADSESEASSDDSFLPGVKSLILQKIKLDKKSKYSGKPVLIDPKPMTYRPRKMRGRDEDYVERKIPPDPKRKRGRPRKEDQLQNETVKLNSSVTITKIPNTPLQSNISLKNIKTFDNALTVKPLPERKDVPTTNRATFENSHSSECKINNFTEKVLTDPKSIQIRPSNFKDKNELHAEREKSLNPVAKRSPKKTSELEHEVSSPVLSTQHSEKSHNSEEKKYVNDCHKNLSNSTGIKDSRKSTCSVKVRPEKFSSRMNFLTKGVEPKPIKIEKMSRKSKKIEDATSAVKNNVPEIRSQNNVNVSAQKQSAALEKTVPVNVSQDSRSDDKHPQMDTSSVPHSLHTEISEDNIFPSTSRSPASTCSVQASSSKRSTSMSIEDNQLSVELRLFSLAKSLVEFKTVWLQEQRRKSYPPPAVTEGVAPLPLSFRSYESYASSFYPLLLLDIWQFIFDSNESLTNQNIANQNEYMNFSFRVLNFLNTEGCIQIKCESVVNDKFAPREGMITILNMNLNSHETSPLFGFIFKHKESPLDSNLIHLCWKNTSAVHSNNAKHWTFWAWIKQKNLLWNPEILMKGNVICYLRDRLRSVDALQSFKDSPLMTDIINPRLSIFIESSSSDIYTSPQKEMIKAVCSEINKPYFESKIALIHEPLDKEKPRIRTHVIEILKALFYASKYNSNLKVLVTARSNYVVDQIGCCLIELNKKYGRRVEFVRVGVEKKVYPAMLPYFIDRKAVELHKDCILQDLRSKIANLEKWPDCVNKRNKLNELNEKYKYIEESFLLKKQAYKTEIKYKCDVLKESHIVLTTLSSCNLSVLSKTFFATSESDLNFSCCIVDQATHCTELETLQPLALGISKLILIGDNRQSPTKHSEYSKRYGLDRSMFKRFCQYFEDTKQPNPVLSLEEEF